MTLSESLQDALAAIGEHARPDGGFAMSVKDESRADATAWAALAFEAAGEGASLVGKACARLAALQAPDGRVPILPGHPEACWPTSLALLAWLPLPEFANNAAKAAAFLLSFTGKHFKRRPDSPMAHDPAIKGWPWIADTHSWVEPTSLAMAALRAAGRGGEPRVAEAARMLLDRQLPDGGWNYGNTAAFGTTLLPVPESSGHALAALAGLVPKERVAASLDYVRREAARVRAPLAASWIIMGLKAWGEAPADKDAMVEESLALQSRYGAYDPALLAQLVTAALFSRSPLYAAYRGS